MALKKIQITLPNKQVLSLAENNTGLDLILKIPPPNPSQIIALQVNDKTYGLKQPIKEDAHISLLTWHNKEGQKIFWKSTACLLANVLQRLYPNAKLGLGKATTQGFYYDVDFGKTAFGTSQLARVEKEMHTLSMLKIDFKQLFMTKKQALVHYQKEGNFYKAELVESILQDSMSFCQQDDHIDLVKGPFLPHTGYIKAIKLVNIAGAYWRSNAKNKQLTRIYGISFPHKEALKKHLNLLEQAKARDHRKVGADLDLFIFSKKVGLGLPLWLPKGAFLRDQLMKVIGDKLKKAGYQFITTPHIGHKDLYTTSGHYQKYSEDTFRPIITPQEDETFLLKSMNCPHHCQVYQSKPRSHKDLPFRLAEFGTVYRYEQHGELHGLMRTRCFTQDDGHVFCMPHQVEEELVKNIKLIIEIFEEFGFQKYTAQIALKDPDKLNKYIGSSVDWKSAEKALVQAATLSGLTTKTLHGEAAFYGPKIDFMIEDSLGRKWQLGTIQLDYSLPQRFGLSYTSSNNEQEKTVMIHRAALGSLERFIGILLEHTKGRLPLWLCLDQVAILPIAQKYTSYAQQVATTLAHHHIRAKIDQRREKITRKIRDAIAAKIPYMLIVGEKEVTEQKVTVRTQSYKEQKTLSMQAFIEIIHSYIKK